MMNASVKIEGGTYAEFGEYASAGVILVRKHGELEVSCGAIVVSNRHVITAAHCVTVYVCLRAS